MGASALPEQRLDNGRAAGTNATPVAEKARVYVLPLYAEALTGNFAWHVCAADNLQTRCKQQAPQSPPQTIPGNRAEIGKMPALKGFRRCPSAHQMHQLISYADGFDEPGHLSNVEWPRAVACARHENAHGVHVRNCAKDAFNVRFVASLHCPARPAYLLTST